MPPRLAAAAVLPIAWAAALLAAPAVLAEDAAKTYYFGVTESRTVVQFESETSVEVIHGVTRSITGTASLDFDKGEGTAELSVPVKTLDTGLPARNEHMKSDGWLDAEKFPDIVFKAKSLKRAKADEAKPETRGKETWAYEGEITIHGVTKALKGEARVERLDAELGKKLGPGSWVKVKTAFQVTLKDFDISVPDVAAAKVAPTWDCSVAIFGTTEAPKKE
jgi:polyisoprenoid-binding protein YceI